MFEKMKELIVTETGIEADKVTMEASFREDLQIDSLDLFELVMTLEENFGVEIPNEDLEKISTVGELVTYVEEHQA